MNKQNYEEYWKLTVEYTDLNDEKFLKTLRMVVNKIDELNKNNNYVIYCKEGKNSSKMCNYLNELGYNTYNLLGGYESWILNK